MLSSYAIGLMHGCIIALGIAAALYVILNSIHAERERHQRHLDNMAKYRKMRERDRHD
jgi:hypothetical protein